MQNRNQSALKDQYNGFGLAIGVVAGAALCLLFASVLESPGMIGVGAVMGVSFGKKIGEVLYQLKMER